MSALATSSEVSTGQEAQGGLLTWGSQCHCRLEARLGCRLELLHVVSPTWWPLDLYAYLAFSRASVPREPGRTCMALLTYLRSHLESLPPHSYSRWAKGRFTVACMENNTIMKKQQYKNELCFMYLSW